MGSDPGIVRKRRGRIEVLALVAVAALALVVAVTPARSAVSFAGKRVTLLISFPPGGGTDTAARLIGRFLAQHLPGAPTMIYQNMPGADGINALNHFYARVDPDGLTVIGGAGNQLNPANLRRPDIVKYDPTRLALVGALANDSSFLIIRKPAIARLHDHGAQPVVMGDLNGTRSSTQMALWGAEGLGWNVKWVLGYAGTPDLLLALHRGEIDMAANNNPAGVGGLLAEGDFTIFAQTGMLVDGRIVPTGLFPDAPLLADLMRGKLAGPVLQAFVEWQQEAQIGKWFALPPGTPDEIVDAYRQAFDAAIADPEFRALAVKQVGPDIKRMSVADLAGLIRALATTPQQTLDTTLGLLRKYGLM